MMDRIYGLYENTTWQQILYFNYGAKPDDIPKY